MIWLALAGVVLVAVMLKVHADERRYQRAWRAERQRFYDWCDR